MLSVFCDKNGGRALLRERFIITIGFLNWTRSLVFWHPYTQVP